MNFKDFPVSRENQKQMDESPKFASVYSVLVKHFIDSIIANKK